MSWVGWCDAPASLLGLKKRIETLFLHIRPEDSGRMPRLFAPLAITDVPDWHRGRSSGPIVRQRHGAEDQCEPVALLPGDPVTAARRTARQRPCPVRSHTHDPNPQPKLCSRSTGLQMNRVLETRIPWSSHPLQLFSLICFQ